MQNDLKVSIVVSGNGNINFVVQNNSEKIQIVQTNVFFIDSGHLSFKFGLSKPMQMYIYELYINGQLSLGQCQEMI